MKIVCKGFFINKELALIVYECPHSFYKSLVMLAIKQCRDAKFVGKLRIIH